MILWMVAKSISRHYENMVEAMTFALIFAVGMGNETMVGTITLVGNYRGIISTTMRPWLKPYSLLVFGYCNHPQ